MSLWTTASEDTLKSTHAKLFATLRVEAVQYWPFLAEAETPTDFGNRLALISTDLDKIVRRNTDDSATFLSSRAELEAAFVKDFDTVHEARRKTAEESGCPDCGKWYHYDESGKQLPHQCKVGKEARDTSYGHATECHWCGSQVHKGTGGSWADKGGSKYCKGGSDPHEPWLDEGSSSRQGSKESCHVVKRGDDYAVIAGGETRGTHPSREEAEKQREAIEVNSSREDAERDSAHMVGSVCRGCGDPANKSDGKVSQRDLGSPEKWHKECYQMYNRRLKKNPNTDKYHGASRKTAEGAPDDNGGRVHPCPYCHRDDFQGYGEQGQHILDDHLDDYIKDFNAVQTTGALRTADSGGRESDRTKRCGDLSNGGGLSCGKSVGHSGEHTAFDSNFSDPPNAPMHSWSSRTADYSESLNGGEGYQGERAARIKGGADSLAQVQNYLPRNYTASQSPDGTIFISGYDNAGWTLDGYVIPRLASGLIFAEEIPESASAFNASRHTASEGLTNADLRELAAQGNELAAAMLKISEDSGRGNDETIASLASLPQGFILKADLSDQQPSGPAEGRPFLGDDDEYADQRGHDVTWMTAEERAEVDRKRALMLSSKTAADYSGWTDEGPGKSRDHVWVGNQPSDSDPDNDWLVHFKDGSTIDSRSFPSEDEALTFAQTKFITSAKTATDFSGGGAGNPFSSPADSATAAPTSVGTVDQQMVNSQPAARGGDDLTPVQNAPTGQAMSSVEVGCLDCGVFGKVASLSPELRCACGSDNLVYESAGELAGTHEEGVVAIHYPRDLIGLVGPDAQGFHYSLSRGDDIYTAGWAPDEDGAKKIVETLAPSYAGAKTSSASDPTVPDEFGLHPDATDGSAHFLHGTWVTASDDENPFAKKKKDDDKDKGDDKGGNETHPPADTPAAPGEAPAPAAGDAPAPAPGQTDAPGEVQVDPNAPPAPGAVPGEVVDPMLQVMDTAQAQVDAAVDQANQLGHDAKEVAYDVDQLFSNWRCQNCQIEGEATISEDGQTALDGDLFDMQPCAAPSAPEDPNQNAENQVPQQSQQNALPQGAPANDGTIPASQQGIPSQTSASNKCSECGKFFMSATQLAQHKEKQGHGKTAAESPLEGDVIDQQSGVSENIEKEERLSVLVEGILDSNPGMNVSAARRLAEQTLAKFPSLA